MPVCRFFVRGNCKRGNSCHFDHVMPEDDYGSDGGSDVRGTSVLKRDSASSYDSSTSYNDTKTYYEDNSHLYKKYNDRSQSQYVKDYSHQQYQSPPPPRYQNDRYHYDPRQNRNNQYQQPQQQQPRKPNYNKPLPNQREISIDDVLMLLKAEIDSIENGRIWPLTSICIVKLFGSLYDWYDYSPEELRLAAYIARASNDFEGFKATIDKIVSRAQKVREFYRSGRAANEVNDYICQNPTTIFPIKDNELDFSIVNYSSIAFSLPGQNQFTSEPIPVFGEQSHQMTDDTEMVSSASKTEDVFGSHQNIVSTVNFGLVQKPDQGASSFAMLAQESKPPKSNVFGFPHSSQQTTNIFGGAIVQQSLDDSQTPRDLKQIFPKLSETDLDIEILSLVWNGDRPYSWKSDLTDEEYEQFKASQFTPGKVPLVPPPKELCS